jgi:Na+/H+ antiporter NhaD/arsenite permease-like protein
VPAVILLLQVWSEPPAGTLYALALLSTLAGNLLIVGSLANIITAERAASVGVHLGFRDHARAGVPVTLLSMAMATVWLWAWGVLPF